MTKPEHAAGGWRALWRDPPGERFQRRNRRLRGAGGGRGVLSVVRTGSGALLCVVGLVLMPLPGPGILIVLVGAALMAGESAPVARGLDRAELWLRARLGRPAR